VGWANSHLASEPRFRDHVGRVPMTTALPSPARMAMRTVTRSCGIPPRRSDARRGCTWPTCAGALSASPWRAATASATSTQIWVKRSSSRSPGTRPNVESSPCTTCAMPKPTSSTSFASPPQTSRRSVQASKRFSRSSLSASPCFPAHHPHGRRPKATTGTSSSSGRRETQRDGRSTRQTTPLSTAMRSARSHTLTGEPRMETTALRPAARCDRRRRCPDHNLLSPAMSA
jgi:hypothetical protein